MVNGGFYTVNVIFTLPVAPSIIFIRKENRLYKAKSTPASHSLRGYGTKLITVKWSIVWHILHMRIP